MEKKTKELRPANTFGVQFIVRQDKLRDGKAPVYARITVNGEIIHFALKQWIDPKFWDARRGNGKGSKDEVALLNDGLEQVRVALAHHYQQLQLKGKYITANAVKDAYLGNDGEEPNLLVDGKKEYRVFGN
jgi:Arm DNA-binding domain